MTICPGQDQRKLTVRDVVCPNCARTVEMFSDELRLRCPHCKTMVYQEQMPSCIQWCEAARDCVGPQMYEELMGKPSEVGCAEPERVVPKPTQILSEEHQLILRGIRLAEQEARVLANGGEFRRARLEKLVDFFRQFAERSHYLKEEELLFEKMAARHMPAQSSPIEVMRSEHAAFRQLMGRLAATLETCQIPTPAEAQRIARILGDYADGLRNHLLKEERILYPLADASFSPADREELASQFAQASAHLGKDFFERYHRLLVDLARD